MIALDMRLQLLALLTEACKAGARWARACALIGLSVRTVQRWQRPQATGGDLRASDQRKPCTPRNQLSEAERLAALELLSTARSSKTCHRARSCRVWPTKAATWPANPRCTA
jgi:hypothetical protein